MSSNYGPDLIKPPETEDLVGLEVGRRKKPDDAEFETDYDRAKRIRKERKAQIQRDADFNQKIRMNQAVQELFDSKKLPSAGPAGPPGPPEFPPTSAAGPFLPSIGPAGPPEFPPTSAAGPFLPSIGPAPPVKNTPPASDENIDSEKKNTLLPDNFKEGAKKEAAKTTIGPARPSNKEMIAALTKAREPATSTPAAAPEAAPAAASATAMPQARVGHMDHFGSQKRMSWDELKIKLGEQIVRDDDAPGLENPEKKAKIEEQYRELEKQEAKRLKMLRRLNKEAIKENKKRKQE